MQTAISLRERLQGLLVFRVVIVTILLGSAVAIDAQALSSLSHSKNLTLLSLIVGTYLLTILYAVGLEHLSRLSALAYLQIGGDMLITAILVAATGGLDSLFVFLFYLNIINAAVVTDRKAAVGTAAAAGGVFVCLALAGRGVIDLPGMVAMRSTRSLSELVYEVGLNSTAALMVAVLAGYLTDRLGKVSGELERQQTNVEQLRALNANILSSLNSGLLTIDSTGAVIFFNRAAEHITGRRAVDVDGQQLDDVFPLLASQLATANSPDVPPAGQLSQTPSGEPRLESVFRRPGGEEVHLGFSVSPLRDSDGQVAGRIVIFQDLSQVKRLEREKKRSERLAAIGEMAAAIAHEIRNPLASISGSVEMLESMGDLDDHDATLMRIILREVDGLDDLITDFLEYSRPRALERSQTDLLDLTREVCGLFDGRSGADDVTVQVVATDGLDVVPAMVDRDAWRQVLWNLLNNAREAMADCPGGGRIRLEVQAGADHWEIAVEDDGPGIDPKVAEQVFDPFFTTKEAGTGLGLATIHRLIDQHDGTIGAGSAEQLSGARLEIELPRLASPADTPVGRDGASSTRTSDTDYETAFEA